jgi:hypothetical protein
LVDPNGQAVHEAKPIAAKRNRPNYQSAHRRLCLAVYFHSSSICDVSHMIKGQDVDMSLR